MRNLNRSDWHRFWPVLQAGSLIVIGVALGMGGTLAFQYQQRSTTSTPTAEPPADKPEAAKVITMDLLLKGEPALGQPNAPVTIVSFSDYECPYCRLFHQKVFPKLKQTFIDTGLVRFIHKDLPMPFHRQAEPSATVARCAQKQKSFWPVHSALLDQQNCLECRGPVAIAVSSGLNAEALKTCLRDPSILEIVRSNTSEAGLHDIRATPTFVLGPTIHEGRHRGQIIEGALPWPQFQAFIQEELAKTKPSP